MKKYVRYFIFTFVNFKTFLFLNYYKFVNRNKKKVFIYTDSRGFQISKAFTRKSPFESYVAYFVKNYNCDVFICPEKHTTIVDFLYQLQKSGGAGQYDKVISHIGVVDFSPRGATEVQPILDLKKHKFLSVFGQSFFEKISNNKIYEQEYMGQKTSSIFSFNVIEEIAEKFNAVPNFLWISCNPIDVTWRGNYMRDRPSNINIVNEKSLHLIPLIKDKVQIIDLTGWSLDQVHQYTCDNIHMSEEGMNLIKNKIIELI